MHVSSDSSRNNSIGSALTNTKPNALCIAHIIFALLFEWYETIFDFSIRFGHQNQDTWNKSCTLSNAAHILWILFFCFSGRIFDNWNTLRKCLVFACDLGVCFFIIFSLFLCLFLVCRINYILLFVLLFQNGLDRCPNRERENSFSYFHFNDL